MDLSTVSLLAVKPFPLSQIRLLDGPFKERQDVHARYLMMVEPDRLLAPFRRQAGLPAKAESYGGWESRDISGHSLGHYLSALSLLYAATADAQVLERIQHIVAELAACQEADGDGYVLPVEKRAFEELRQGKVDASAFGLNGVWVPFYTLHKVLAGLRDAYRLAGSVRALKVERNVCDWLDGILRGLNAEQIQEVLRSEHGGMNEVLEDLAADTGDSRYLTMAAKYFHHNLILDPMLRGEDKLDGLHGNTQIPKVVGLAREYELTSETAYRTAAESFWDNVVNRRSFANGGHGESEHFFPLDQFPEKLTPNTCETCNTYNMLKLTSHLFAWEPQAAQMDFVERALINHLLANIGRAPGEFGYFLGLGSVGVKVFSTPFDSWWCCVGTGLENQARYGEQIYFHDDKALWVNLFLASTLDWPERGLKLQQETRFPDADTTRFIFACDKPVTFALKLRHPYWCQAPQATINGEPVPILSTPSSYMTFERTWHSGDTLELHVPMSLRLEPLPHSDDKLMAVMFGPMLLAAVIPDEAGIPNPAKQRYSEHLSARGKTDAFPPLFVATSWSEVLPHLKPTQTFAEFRSHDLIKPEDLTLIPLHRIYEEQYAVYFPRLSSDEWTQSEAQILAQQQQQKRREAATIDSLTPGYQQPEVEHGFRSEHSEVKDFGGRKCRTAAPNGWFSYQMTVDPAHPVTLTATYWGGVWHERHFDILVDNEKIATQRLQNNKPGEFFEATYPIPAALTHGKTKVTVLFKAHAFTPNQDDTASGPFELRIMRQPLSQDV